MYQTFFFYDSYFSSYRASKINIFHCPFKTCNSKTLTRCNSTNIICTRKNIEIRIIENLILYKNDPNSFRRRIYRSRDIYIYIKENLFSKMVPEARLPLPDYLAFRKQNCVSKFLIHEFPYDKHFTNELID